MEFPARDAKQIVESPTNFITRKYLPADLFLADDRRVPLDHLVLEWNDWVQDFNTHDSMPFTYTGLVFLNALMLYNARLHATQFPTDKNKSTVSIYKTQLLRQFSGKEPVASIDVAMYKVVRGPLQSDSFFESLSIFKRVLGHGTHDSFPGGQAMCERCKTAFNLDQELASDAQMVFQRRA